LTITKATFSKITSRTTPPSDSKGKGKPLNLQQ
jgi:hypothetical protein